MTFNTSKQCYNRTVKNNDQNGKLDLILLASKVLSFGDGLLGDPVPRVFVAITLNSYSVHGDKSITVAISSFPSTTAGATGKCVGFV